MNQLRKHLFLALCVFAVLLVMLGLRRKFGGDGEAALLSQPSDAISTTTSEPARSAPRPRVLQARPVTQQEQAVFSPTNSPYANSETEGSPANGVPILPLSTPSPPHLRQPVAAPELVPLDEPTPSPAPGSIEDGSPKTVPFIETPTVPVAARPSTEFVLTDADDSFWSISERVYGSGVYYRALFHHNEAKVLRPDQLRAGVEVRTPPLDVLQQLYPADFPAGASLTP